MKVMDMSMIMDHVSFASASYYPRRHLWRHTCKFAPKNRGAGKMKRKHAIASLLLLPKKSSSSNLLSNVLSYMRVDNIGRMQKAMTL